MNASRPGGGQEAGKTRRQTLRREIREETGAELLISHEYFIDRIRTDWVDEDQRARTLVHAFEIANCLVSDDVEENVLTGKVKGCRYLAKIAINEENSSPLVIEALEHFNAVDPDIVEKYEGLNR